MPSPSETIKIAKTLTDPVFTGTGTAPTLVGTATGTAETEFSQLYNLPPNILKAGSIIEIDATGSYSATVGTTTSVIQMRFGPTTTAVASRGPGGQSLVTTAGGVDVADNFAWLFMGWKIVILTAGTSGTYTSVGGFVRPTANSGNAAIASRMNHVGSANAIVDTTVQNTLSITNIWSLGDASTAHLDLFTVSIRGR